MRIDTGVRYNRRRTYRLIGRDLYSAPTTSPLREQAYTLEKAGLVEADPPGRMWRVVVCDDEVCLDA